MTSDNNTRAAPAGQAPALSRLLEQTADAVQAVRGGRSLTDVLAACPAPLRPGTQALSFLVLRRLGAAQARARDRSRRARRRRRSRRCC